MRNTPVGIEKTIRRWYNSRLAVVLESILIGLITGLVVVGFRYALFWAEGFRARLYGTVLPAAAPYQTGLWILALIITGIFLGWAVKRRPMIKGSGIPQVKGALLRLMSMDWKRELPLKLICGFLGLGAGLSLGREGPSIQVGAYVGRGVLSILHRPNRERKYLITAASAAGLAAAFNAPLAGVLFIQEELQSGFSPLLLACAMGASMTADAVAGGFFGLKPVFDFRAITALPLESLPWIALLGVLSGFLGDLFKRALYAGQDLYARLKIPQALRPALPLLLSVPLGFFLFDVTGGGHSLIESLSQADKTLGMIVLLWVVKLLFTVICYGSGTAGGIFLPLLACGALTGAGFGLALDMAGILSGGVYLNFLILGMAAFFTAVVGGPLTGIVLILEMSGNFNHLGNLVLVCLSAYMTINLLASRPVYTVLLERLLGNRQGPVSGAASQELSAGPWQRPPLG